MSANKKVIQLTEEGKLKVIIDGKESTLTDEQTACFFDKPNTPQFFYTMYLFQTNPQEAKHWVYLRLLEIEFVRTFMAIEGKKLEKQKEALEKEEANNYGYNVEVTQDRSIIDATSKGNDPPMTIADDGHIVFNLPKDKLDVQLK